MQKQSVRSDRPDPSEIPALVSLREGAERSLERGEMLTDLQGKAFFEFEVCIAAKKAGKGLPPSTLPVVWDDGQWWFPVDSKNDRAETTSKPIPQFLFWCEMMDRNRTWVQVLGTEDAIAIAMMLQHPKSRETCLRALGVLARDEAADTGVEEVQRAFSKARRHMRGNLLPMFGGSASVPTLGSGMTEPPELFQAEVRRIAEKKGIDVDSEFFAGATK